MTDTAIGFVLLGIGMLVVLGIVFAISSRGGPATPRPEPPRGVHLPGPSWLPVVLALAGALLGAGLAFRADGELANPFLAIPGLLVLVAGAVAWVRAANHEWRNTEHGSHDDRATH
ncbi:MAG TPA: hypothetical protein VMM85_05100 [Methylomirabilota bacterium]|nr:hypothetical protein [Methylomirabilota bacterium]